MSEFSAPLNRTRTAALGSFLAVDGYRCHSVIDIGSWTRSGAIPTIDQNAPDDVRASGTIHHAREMIESERRVVHGEDHISGEEFVRQSVHLY